MDKKYCGGCPVCCHQGLVFLADSGVWQASKDRMRPGLPYAHEQQIVRWCCTCCNNALQESTDRTLHQWFSEVIAAKDGPSLIKPPRLTHDNITKIRELVQTNIKHDKIVSENANKKGYTVHPGTSATPDQVIDMVKRQRHCSTTNVQFDFAVLRLSGCFQPIS